MADQEMVLIPPDIREKIVQWCGSSQAKEWEVLSVLAHDLEELAKRLEETRSRTAANPIFRVAAELRLATSSGC